MIYYLAQPRYRNALLLVGSFVFYASGRVEHAALLAVCGMAGYRDRLQLAAGASPKLTLFLQPREDALDAAGGLVEQLRLQQNELQLQGQ